MKKLQILAAIVVLAAGIFSSCKKASSNNNTSTPTSTYYVIANIVGGNPPSWVASTVSGSNSGPLGSGTITILGTMADGESITLTFPNNVTPGYYPWNTAPTYVTESYTLNSSPSGYYNATSGSITIKSISLTGAVSGTFTFNALDQTNNATVNITNGSFNVKL